MHMVCVASNHNRPKDRDKGMKGQYPKFLIPNDFYSHLDHKSSCHLEIIQRTQRLLSKTRKAEHSLFEVILPLPSERKKQKKKDLLKNFFFNKATQ